MTEGKLFLVQMPLPDGSRNAVGQKKCALRKIEHYWMCDNCAGQLTIVFDASLGMLTVPLPGTRKPAASVPQGPVVPNLAAGIGSGRRT